MLKYQASTNLTNITEGECTRIVIYDKFGNPVAFTAQLDNNKYISSHIGNPDFTTFIKLLALDKLKEEED